MVEEDAKMFISISVRDDYSELLRVSAVYRTPLSSRSGEIVSPGDIRPRTRLCFDMDAPL